MPALKLAQVTEQAKSGQDIRLTHSMHIDWL